MCLYLMCFVSFVFVLMFSYLCFFVSVVCFFGICYSVVCPSIMRVGFAFTFLHLQVQLSCVCFTNFVFMCSATWSHHR